MRVSARGQHLEDTLPQLEYRDIRRAAAKIINSDGALLTLIQAVCERRSSGFIDDTEHIQAGNTSRILGCLPLRIIEIGGNGDHRVLDLVAQRCFRVSFELAQNKCGKLGRCVIASEDFQADNVFALGRDLEGKQGQIGADVLNVWKTAFVRVAVSHATGSGNRAFVLNGQPVSLNFMPEACMVVRDE